MSLRETKIAVEAVDQNLKGIVQGLEMMLSRRISFRPQFGFGFKPEGTEIGEQMAEDLEFWSPGKQSNCNMIDG